MQACPQEFIGIAVSGTEAAVDKGSIFPGLAGHEILYRAGRGLSSRRRRKEKCRGEDKKNDSNTVAASGHCSLNGDTPLPFFQLSSISGFFGEQARAYPSTKVSGTAFGEGTVAKQEE
jgi:hypothetical protein